MELLFYKVNFIESNFASRLFLADIFVGLSLLGISILSILQFLKRHVGYILVIYEISLFSYFATMCIATNPLNYEQEQPFIAMFIIQQPINACLCSRFAISSYNFSYPMLLWSFFK